MGHTACRWECSWGGGAKCFLFSGSLYRIHLFSPPPHQKKNSTYIAKIADYLKGPTTLQNVIMFKFVACMYMLKHTRLETKLMRQLITMPLITRQVLCFDEIRDTSEISMAFHPSFSWTDNLMSGCSYDIWDGKYFSVVKAKHLDQEENELDGIETSGILRSSTWPPTDGEDEQILFNIFVRPCDKTLTCIYTLISMSVNLLANHLTSLAISLSLSSIYKPVYLYLSANKRGR